VRAYADSSFILRLVTAEADSEAAIAEYRRIGLPPLFFLPLHALEIQNAILQRAFHERRSLPSRARQHIARERDAAFDRLERFLSRRTLLDVALDLDAVIEGRIRHGEDSPDLDNARSTFRSLIVRLGEAPAIGGSDPRTIVDPFVEALLVVRARARNASDWATADLVREQLAAAGVEVRDGADGSTWTLGGSAPR